MTKTLLPFLLVGFGGFIGAISRYAIMLLSQTYIMRYLVHYEIIATLCVNVIGSFLVGLFFSLLQTNNITNDISPLLKAFFSIGFLGAFTTFSAFSLQNLTLLHSSEFEILALNIVLNVALCLLATWVGFCLMRP